MPRVTTRERAKLAVVGKLSNEQLACRAGRHPWPVLIPGLPIPDGIRPTPNHDGSFQITETCPICGSTRTRTTLPKGSYDRSAHYAYRHPEDWLTIHQDEEVTRGDIVAELYRRVGPELFGLVQ